METYLNSPGWNFSETQGVAIYFESDHCGKLTHYRAGQTETCTIRFALGFIDPPGHEQQMNPYHVVKQQYSYAYFPPGVDGQLQVGEGPFDYRGLSDWDSTDWVGTYTAFAKTTFTVNGGSEIVGAYDSRTFESTP